MTRPPRIGVHLPETEYLVRWPEPRAMAETAEAVGLDSISVSGHLLNRQQLVLGRLD